MKYLKGKVDYENAKKELAKKTTEIKNLKKSIQNYENENLIPEFEEMEDLRSFLSEEPEENTIFKYRGNDYNVLDIEDFIKEYGYDQWNQAVSSADFGDLLNGGRISVIENRK